jgi:flagellar basal body-associated protein FliL
MKKKLIIVLVLVLAVGGFAAKTILLKPKPVKLKVTGEVYVLPHQFTLNLADGRYATLTAALILAPGQSDGATAAGGTTDASAEVGTLPEEAVIRDIITNVVTGQTSQELISAAGRAKVKSEILADIRSGTDDKISEVLFPDLAVQ